jgi:hypothetical protein
MKLSIISYHLLPFAAAAVVSRQEPGRCCFTLTSVGVGTNSVVKEDTIGQLRIDGRFPQAFLCLDPATGTIQDGLDHQCFIDSSHQFECYQGLRGKTQFSFTAGMTVTDANAYLTYDGIDLFYACPADGPGVEVSYLIFGLSKPDRSGCKEVRLVQQNLAGTCPTAPRPASAPTSASAGSLASAPTSETALPPAQAPLPFSDRYSQFSTESCIVNGSSILLNPIRIGPGPHETRDPAASAQGRGLITVRNATIFDFEFPALPEEKTCVLYFLLQICTLLPEGYPCHIWSGMEQQYLAKSGMVFSQLGREGWESQLVQTEPGEWSLVTIFPCGGETPHTLSFMARAVKGWYLEFTQVGVGKWKNDGMGAFLFTCS